MGTGTSNGTRVGKENEYSDSVVERRRQWGERKGGREGEVSNGEGNLGSVRMMTSRMWGEKSQGGGFGGETDGDKGVRTPDTHVRNSKV